MIIDGGGNKDNLYPFKNEQNNMIFISKPFLPPINEYLEILESIWKSSCLTNNGVLVRKFEKKLDNYLKLKNSVYVSSGTIAIQIALKVLEIKREVITTPFSHIATTNSLVWEGCTPVFVDIDNDSLNIDANKIEKSITKKTEAILATHCFGNPCDIDLIENIAKKHNLKVIYDASHCFGVKYKGKSIFNWGDISTTSFHATKIFHTVEGGALFSKNKKIADKIKLMRAFGQENMESFKVVGINAKNSEFHATMGLCNLKYIEEILKKREKQFKKYDFLFKKVSVKRQNISKNTDYNYSYYPLIFEKESILLKVKKGLEANKVFARRYFYPSLNKISYLGNKNRTPIAEDIAKRVLCFPLYHELKEGEQIRIAKIIYKLLN